MRTGSFVLTASRSTCTRISSPWRRGRISWSVSDVYKRQARYIGGEVNMVKKDPAGKIRFAMAFPDVYELGMSHLGIQILYDMFNKREDVYCERVYSPWMDLDQICLLYTSRCV